MKDRILIAIDINDDNDRLISQGIELANSLGKDIQLFHNVTVPKSAYMGAGVMDSVPPGEIVEYDLKVASAELKGLSEEIDDALNKDLKCRYGTSYGTTESAILNEEERLNPDMILMGRHERENFLDSILKTSVKRIINGADCPVMIVPQSNK